MFLLDFMGGDLKWLAPWRLDNLVFPAKSTGDILQCLVWPLCPAKAELSALQGKKISPLRKNVYCIFGSGGSGFDSFEVFKACITASTTV